MTEDLLAEDQKDEQKQIDRQQGLMREIELRRDGRSVKPSV